MKTQTTITLRQACDHYRIDFGIIRDFAEFGLYPTVFFEGEMGIEIQYLDKLERVISLHQALGINKEGIEVVLGLREKNEALQKKVERLEYEIEKMKRHLEHDEPDMLNRLGLLIEIDD